jgi:hypothetical protein
MSGNSGKARDAFMGLEVLGLGRVGLKLELNWVGSSGEFADFDRRSIGNFSCSVHHSRW